MRRPSSAQPFSDAEAGFVRTPRHARSREAEPRRPRGDRWARWEADGTYRFDRTKSAGRDLLDRHAAAHGAGSHPHGPCSATRRPTPSPATSGCAASRSSTRSGGTTTASPPSAGCRTTTACAATRRCPTTPTSRRRPRRRPQGARRGPDLAAQLRRAVPRAHRRSDEAAFEELFRRLGLSVDWSLTYTTIGDGSRRTSQAAFLRNLARGEAYSAEAPTLWDVDDRTAVAQAEIEDRERPGAYHRIAFHGPAGDVLIETTAARADRQLRRPGRPSRRRALPAAVRHDGAHPAVRRRGPRRRPPARRPREGHRHRHDLHVRRHHRRHVVARARPADAQRDRPRRPLQRGDAGVAHRAPPAPRPTPRSPGAPSSRRRRRPSSCCARRASCTANRADHPPGQVLRAGQPAAGDRHQPAVVHPQRRPRPGPREALLARGKELPGSPDHMRHRYDHWVEGLNGDWLISRQRFFGVPIPLWYPVGDDGEPDFDQPIVPGEDALPIDPSTDVPAGYDEAARPAGRLRRRSRRHGHLGDVVAHAADRRQLGRRPRPVRPRVPDGPAPAGPGDHPHLAVRHGRALPLRARLAAVGQRRDQRLDPRPRPQEDVEVEGQRRHADGAVRAVRHRRRALLGDRRRPAGRRHRRQRGADEGRPPPRHQAAQRHQVRPRHR